MKVYLDSSVVLSQFLRQPNRRARWGNWEAAYTSSITRVEILRYLGRLRLQGTLTDAEVATLQEQLATFWKAVSVVALTDAVLERSAMPMPTVLGTLDALHLSTALLLTELRGEDLTFCTHDHQLATGAKAHGVLVEGVESA